MQDELDLTTIDTIIKDVESNVDHVKKLSDDIVNNYVGVLDDLMKAITKDVIENEIVADSILEKYFLELTNALYFIGSKSEFLGLYEDLSKANTKIKYNKAFSENQLKSIASGKKTTVDENRIYGENNSINETIVSSLYARSFKIIKAKIDSANEMVKTLSKIISKRMNEKDYSTYTNPFNETREGRGE